MLAQLQRSDPGYTLDANSLYTIGSSFLRNDQFAEALGVYGVYTKLNPGQPRGWNGLGDAYAGIHDTVNAVASYREALKVAPENARAIAGLKKMGQGPPVQEPTALATSSSPALAQRSAIVKLDSALDEIVSSEAKLELLKEGYFGFAEGPL